MFAIGFGLVCASVCTLVHNYLSSLSSLSLSNSFLASCKKLRLYLEYGNDIALPTINDEITFDWGKRLLVHLPSGLPSAKFLEKREALAEAMRINPNRFHMRYDDGLIIDIVTADFPKMLPYRPSESTHSYRVFIGVNERGEARYYDFAGKYPHLLIGGISGGGKSVMLRNILTQLVTGPAPDLYLCDLKGGVELGIFRNLACVKHLATELSQVLIALNIVESEMKRRYAAMLASGTQEWHGKRLIFVVDELADFKTRAGDPDAKLKNEIKSVTTRLSAKGRAAGVIIVLATQRPSADVVDGLIKTNIAASICFRTRDAVQSRIVIDSDAAANLPDIPGRLVWQTAFNETLQAPFISAADARKLIAGLPQKGSENTEFVTVIIDKEDHQHERHKYENSGEIRTLESNIIEL